MNVLNFAMRDISRDRLLITLITLLLSAMVLAEQSAESPSYDELMKNTIYGNAGRWRGEESTDDNDWRSTKDEDSTFGYNSTGNSNWRSDKHEQSSDLFKDETLEPGYRLFKIEI
jgi:hypothetical protein